MFGRLLVIHRCVNEKQWKIEDLESAFPPRDMTYTLIIVRIKFPNLRSSSGHMKSRDDHFDQKR